jgi:uncharacterized protein
MTAGVNRLTGKPLAGLDHVRQSLGVIFTTRLTSRLLRRLFGFAGVGLLGEPLTPQTLMKFYMAVVIAVELWEPRFKVIALSYPNADNSASELGQGRFGVAILGAYRPNALEGDFTVAATVSVVI